MVGGKRVCISGPRAGTNRAEMNRLRRFYEKVPYGQASSRVAFAAFKAGEAILANPLLKEAILKGCAFEKAKND